MSERTPEGWWVAVRQSLTRPMLLGGIPLHVIIGLYAMGLGLGLAMRSWVPVIAVVVVHLGLITAYAHDPRFLEVLGEFARLDGGDEPPEKAARRLPWAFLVGPEEGMVLQKSGALQRTWRFGPPDMDSTTLLERKHLAAQLNNALKRLGSGWSVFVEARREATEGYPAGTFPDAVTALIDEERQEMFEGGREHYATRYYLTLTYQPPKKEKSKQRFLKLFVDDPQADKSLERQLEKAIETFERGAEPVTGLLERQFPEWEPLDDEATLTYLHSSVTGEDHPVRAEVPEMYIDALVGDFELEAGLGLKVDGEFVETLTLRGFPAAMYPGVLKELDKLAIPYRWMQRFICLDQSDAASEIDTYRKGWNQLSRGMSGLKSGMTGVESSTINRGMLDQQEDAEEARRELENGHVSFGFYTGTVVVSGQTKAEAQERLEQVAKAIQERGFTTIKESAGTLAGWLGSLPGNATENVRRPLLHTLNLAHLLPLSGTWAGMAENDHLGAEAHVQAATTGTTPFRVNLNVGDVGHTLVLGKTGSGKSTLLGLLAAQWLRYDDAQVFFFDKGKSSRALTYGVQGAFYEPGGENTELAFQPLAFVDDKTEREWVAEWLESLIEMQKGEVTAAVREKLWQALERMARQPRERRTMSQLVRLAGDQELSRWLRAYTKAGPYGDLLDANEETLSLERWVSFEMGALMERKEIVGPILEYLFHRLEARFDGSPTLLMLDEAWIYLDNPTFRARIRQWLKTLRKHNVYVVFASQEIVDALESEIASSLLSACPTRILLPHPGAGSEAMRPHFERLGLNGAQIEMLSNAEEKRHYYYSSPRGQRLFELGLERCPIALRFVGASSPEHQEEMDEILATESTAEFAAAWLQRGGFNEAAATVRALREESGEANGFADVETVMAPEFELPVADAGARSRRDPWDAETIVDERFQPKEREAYS